MAGTSAISATDRAKFQQHLESGGELLRTDRVAEARAKFEQALALEPEDSKALGLLGLACFRLSAFADARDVYRKLVARHPDDASYRLNLGLVHLKLSEPEQAIVELTQARELDPSMSRAVSYLGLAHARAGQFLEAYEAFLHVGQHDLAAEMEQNLDEAQIAAARKRVRPESQSDPAPAPSEFDDAEARGSYDEGAPAVEAAEDETDASAHVIEEADAEPEPEPEPAAPRERSRSVTAALEIAAPSGTTADDAAPSMAGHRPPQTLSQFATSRLIRPDDGDHPFEIGAGGVLIIRVRGKMMSRTEGVIVSGGELSYEPATRRVRGHRVDEPFSGERPLFIVSGEGHMVASPIGNCFSAVRLSEDVLYVREDLVFAFEDCLRWENGFVPGSDARISVVQFRGEGCVAIRTRRPSLAVKLIPERVLYIDAEALAGWVGRVVPRVVAPAAGGDSSALFVECSGEGVVLLEDEGSLASGYDTGES